jgi:small subunit ribosomal protein S5
VRETKVWNSEGGRLSENRRKEDSAFKEKVIKINRVSKVVKGGKRFSFNALIIVGGEKGLVGSGLGKSKDVSDAIRKGVERAKKSMIAVSLKDTTIPFRVTGHFGASFVIIKPAPPGTGIVAGGPVRAIMECAGINDVVTKSLGSNNPFNLVYATFNGLTQLKSEEEIRRIRGKEVVNETK